MQKDRIKAIQETIAGFLREQVINPTATKLLFQTMMIICISFRHWETKLYVYMCYEFCTYKTIYIKLFTYLFNFLCGIFILL